ncbi:unnamed protein product [Adineta steineri]|uniref:PSI domain-containing protein n=1 Tax=Adineta steineri TaxID=433720 RepID=A0A818MTD8_9BILA|nr:unnamed protein product [Adineta steineri]CAF3594415.1 unnamed protein product [Adineta steineri]
MKYFIQILFYFIFLFNKSIQIDENVLLINDPKNTYYPSYTIVTSTNRLKRDKPPLFNAEIKYSNIISKQCDQHIYTKLSSCSQLTECTALASCLESIHCSSDMKSYGSLILNLFHLLGINNCNNYDLHTLCPNDKRLIILHNLLTHWTDNVIINPIDYEEQNNAKIDDYCETIPNFISEVKKEINEQCSMYLRQVEAFLEGYICSTNQVELPSTSIATQLEQNLHWSKLDEEDELNFIDSDKNLLNTTEQTVYVNDHRYYNVSYIIPKSEGKPLYFVEDTNQFIHIHALSDRHRSAFSINLKFNFPFYGHSINKILIGTGGFIYTGDLLHSALIGSTQYIAPFMANFDVSIGGNQSTIKYFDNSTHFICTWNNLYLQDQQDTGSFTFQTILENNGNIYFNYMRIPQVKISNINHAHRIGVSDAYMSEHATNDHIVRVITLYDKINLDKEKIKNGVSIIFYMDNTCNTFTDCASCLANRGKRYNCSWCDNIQKCSDGYDRSRHQWIRAQCHRLASEDTCPINIEDTLNDNNDNNRFLLTPSFVDLNKIPSQILSRQHSTFYTFRTIIITLLITVLILSLIAFLGSYIYAYLRPTSPPGIWLLEHRPSNYIARFKRSSSTNNDLS